MDRAPVEIAEIGGKLSKNDPISDPKRALSEIKRLIIRQKNSDVRVPSGPQKCKKPASDEVGFFIL